MLQKFCNWSTIVGSIYVRTYFAEIHIFSTNHDFILINIVRIVEQCTILGKNFGVLCKSTYIYELFIRVALLLIRLCC